MRRVLVGAGGNAKSISAGIDAYIDPAECRWLSVPRIEESDLTLEDVIVLGLGGVTPEQLGKRLALRDRLALITSPDNHIVIKEGAVVEPSAVLKPAVLVNVGAIVCHDAVIGAGTHIAPGAIVLGGAVVGECCMIGAGAVILPGAIVPHDTLVKALTRWG